MSSNHELVTGWRNCKLKIPPFIFPGDEINIKNNVSVFRSFDEYVSSENLDLAYDHSLHLGLIPIPYLGDIEKASVYVLMLNPGLKPGDYFAEEKIADYKNRLVDNLRQENLNREYPFFLLDPQYAWHPGFEYWYKKFHDIISEITKVGKIEYQAAASLFSQKIACLELLPYHSQSFRQNSLLDKLSSVQTMRKYVQNFVVPKAENGQAIVVVTRSVKNWKLQEHEKIICYGGSEPRGASLSLKSRGGKAILDFFMQKYM